MAEDKIIFTEFLLDQVGKIGSVLGELLDTQAKELQQSLNKRFPSIPADAVQQVLSAFSTLQGTKQPLARDKIQISGLSQEQLTFCLKELEDRRILRKDEEAFELAHDTLALRIAELRNSEEVALLETAKLIRDRRDAFSTTNTYLNARELHLIESLNDRLRPLAQLDEDDWEFVAQSQEASKRRRRRIYMVIASIMIALALLAIFGWAQSIIAENQRKIAYEQKEKAESEKQKAYEKEQEAIIAKKDAENQRSKAEKSKIEAETARKEAETNSWLAYKAKRRAESALILAEEQRTLATENATKAEKARKKSEEQRAQLEDQYIEITSLNENLEKSYEAVQIQKALATGNYLKAEALLTLQKGNPTKAFRIAEYALKEGDPEDLQPTLINIFYAQTFLYNDSLYSTPFYKDWYTGPPAKKALLNKDETQLYLLLAGQKNLLKKDLKTGTISQFEAPEKLKNFAISPGGNYVAAISEQDQIIVWKTGGELFYTFKNPKSAMNDLTFLDEETILTGGDNRELDIWALPGAQGPEARFKELTIGRHTSFGFNMIRVSPSGEYIVAISSSEVRLFKRNRRQNYEKVKFINNLIRRKKSEAVFVFADFDEKEETLVVLSRNTGYLIDLKRKLKSELVTFPYSIETATLRQDGEYLAVSFRNLPFATLYHIPSKKEVIRFQGHTGPIHQLQFTQQKDALYTVSIDGHVYFWDIAGKPILKATQDLVSKGDDDKPVQSGYTYNYENGNIEVRDPENEIQWAIEGPKPSNFIISPDGSSAVKLLDDSKIGSLWENNGNRQLLIGHNNTLQTAGFAPNSEYLITGSADGAVILWDKEGTELHSFGPGGNIVNTYFSTDGKSIYAQQKTGAVIQYPVQTNYMIELANNLDIPPLTKEEIKRLEQGQ